MRTTTWHAGQAWQARHALRARQALLGLEGLLLARGHRTARRNAWASVQEDRRRARARTEAERLLDSARERTRRAT